MVFTLPLPPNLANTTYAHWSVKRKAMKRYMESCDHWWLLEGRSVFRKNGWRSLGTRTTPFLRRAEISATLYLHQRMDTDNLMARLKWPIDWVVQMGFIADDSLDHLIWIQSPQQEILRSNAHVSLTLREEE